MTSSISRRAFLVGGSAVVLAACSKKDGTVIDARDDAPDTSAPATSKLNLVLASFQPLAVADQRVAFAVIDAKTSKPLQAKEVRVAFAPDGPASKFGEAVTAAAHAEGIENRPYFLARTDFAKPGLYKMQVTYEDRVAEAPLEVADPATSKVPVPGQPLISTPTPTTADARGVNPICTRQPACPWHDVSLDAALGEKKPIVLLFGTPALCQSATCGPVLDILLQEAPSFGDRIRFLHVEVFTDSTGKTVAPALRAYNLENEPFLFLAGADGVVRERLDGPFDRSEARDALNRLAAP